MRTEALAPFPAGETEAGNQEKPYPKLLAASPCPSHTTRAIPVHKGYSRSAVEQTRLPSSKLLAPRHLLLSAPKAGLRGVPAVPPPVPVVPVVD